MGTENNSRKTDLVKSTVIIGIGYIIPTVINLLLLPLYTKNLTKEEYGMYDLFIVVAGLVVPVVLMRLDAGLFRFLISSREDERKTKEVLSSVLLIALVTPAVVFAALLVPFWKAELVIRFGIVLYIYFSAIYATIGYTTRGLGRNDIYVKMVCVQFVILLLLSVVFVSFYDMHLPGVLIAMNIAIVISIVYGCAKVKIVQYISLAYFSKSCFREILNYSFPMVPNNIAMWVVNTSDRLIITGVLGLGANGIYAIANKFPAYMSQVTGVFNMSWQENASMYVDDKDAGHYFSEITNSILNILFSMAALLLGLAPFMFMLLVKTDYTEAYPQLPILVVGLLFSCMTSHYGSIYLALKRTKIIGFTSVAGAVLNLVINIMLVRKIGLYAASISTLISFGIIMVVRMSVLKKYIRVEIDRKRMIIGTLLLTALSVMYYINIWWLSGISVLIATVYSVYLNNKLIKAVLSKGRVKSNDSNR